MMDYSTGLPTYITGNYLAPLGTNTVYYILCSSEEYEQAQAALKGYMQDIPTENMIRLENPAQVLNMHPFTPIYLYGSWRESDLFDMPRMMALMNGWL
jgi:hypothetical protein